MLSQKNKSQWSEWRRSLQKRKEPKKRKYPSFSEFTEEHCKKCLNFYNGCSIYNIIKQDNDLNKGSFKVGMNKSSVYFCTKWTGRATQE